MSKIKILEINKNLMTHTQNVMDKVITAQSEAQKQITKAKRLEADLMVRIAERDAQRANAKEEAAAQAETPPAYEPAKTPPTEIHEAAAAKAPEQHAAEPVTQPAVKQEPEKPAERQAERPAEAPVTAAAEKTMETTKIKKPTTAEANPQTTEAVTEAPVKKAETVAEAKPAVEKPQPTPVAKPVVERAADRPLRESREDFLNRIRERERAAAARSVQPPRDDNRRPQGAGRYGDRPQQQGRPGYNNNNNNPRYGDRPQQGRPGYNNNNNNPRYGDRPAGDRPRTAGPGRPGAARDTEERIPTKGDIHKTRTAPPASKAQKDRKMDEKKPRKTGIKEKGVIMDDEFPSGSKKIRRNREKPAQPAPQPVVVEKAIITGETVSVKLFAEKTGKPVAAILKKLLLLGMMCTINSEIDYDTATLVAGDFGIELEQRFEQTAEDVLIAEDKEDTEEDLIIRPPVVTIMGHVDHGKTSLLDKIRLSRVQESEAGGITQHIGAYTVRVGDRSITFLDTPGHEAFTAMRARGAQVTDIAILVVAADDGVMPQTIEAINHAKAAKVPIIVAINKIDTEGANVDRIKQSLTEYGLVAEEWGGETVMVPVSAKTGEGIPQLLEMILLVADVGEFRANPDRLAKGAIIEARLDKGRGPVATVLIQNGTLHVSDNIVAGTATGRIRAMVDDRGKPVKSAGPSKPVEVIGFSEVPEAGDIMYVVEHDKLSRQVAEERRDKIKAAKLKKMSKISLDDLFNQIAEGQIKELDLVVKADVQGSVEAVTQALEKISNEEVRVRVIHSGVGAISETDVMLASAANAIIIGFNVRPDSTVTSAAEREKVDIRLYRVIYNAIEDVEKAMKGMLAPEFREEVLGHAEIRQTFKVSSVGTIAGCYVLDGKMQRNASIRLLRNSVIVHEGKLSSLKRFKDDAKEVASGYECGLTIDGYNDLKDGDVIEAFEMVEIEK